MKVVIASDSYKESLSALDVGRAIAEGVREIFPDAVCEVLPVADGGEGTVEALVDATGGSYETRTVTGPLGQPLAARFGRLGDGRTAVIEMAAASGLMHVAPSARDPMATTTRGTGELIRAALDLGQRHLILGIGGSATVDGGIGMLQALGVRLLDDAGRPVGEGGRALSRLASIDASGLDPRLAECVVEVACDVDNPLTGPHGAAAVFGPQKGATPDMVADLDRWLGVFAGIVARDLGIAVADVPGAGAAP
ncbi:MAG: glycerate kinase [Telmatospirillum sp.]|nr:glycerate kinase [Telmatospirillum sp.]